MQRTTIPSAHLTYIVAAVAFCEVLVFSVAPHDTSGGQIKTSLTHLGDGEINRLLSTRSDSLLPPLSPLSLLKVEVDAQTDGAVFADFVIARPQGILSLEESLP